MSDRCDFYVYEHRRLSTGEVFYVGKGRNRRAYSKHSRNPYWRAIVAKDGGFDIILRAVQLPEELAFFAEIELIDSHRRMGVNLANMSDGGEGPKGRIVTDATRKKLREKIVSKEARSKMRAAKLGHIKSKETCKKLSEALRRNHFTRTTPDMRGFKHTAEARRKMREAKLGTKMTIEQRAARSRAVLCVDTGERFISAIEAARHFGVSYKTSVANCCNGKCKSAHGHVFKYAEQNDG